MTNTPIVFTDLDDTIFAGSTHYPGVDPKTLRLAAREGRLSPGYLCSRREGILTWLQAGASIIPVTARERAAFEDVDIPFVEESVVANGTMIINPDGNEDIAWRDKMEATLLEARHALDEVEDALKTFDTTGTLFKIDWYWVGDHVYGMTAKVLDTTIPQDDIETALHETITQRGLYDHVRPSWVNDYLGFMPNGIGKAAAVEHLLATRPQFQDRPTIGMGDATTDLQFMALCDMMVLPKDSVLARKLIQSV